MNQLLTKLKPPASMSTAEMAKDLLKQGYKVLDLSIGEPDCQLPGNIATRLSNFKHTKYPYTYSRGIPELIHSISDYMYALIGVRYSEREIMVTPGGKQAIWYVLTSILNPDDEVIVLEPSWLSYGAEILLARGKKVSIYTSRENGYFPTREQLEQAVTERTRLIILNSPCNPTGRVYNKKELKLIAEFVQKYDLWVLSDEIYSSIIFDDGEFVSIASLPTMKERTIIVNGFSKTFAIPGLRIGFLCGPEHIVNQCLLVHQHVATCVNTFSQQVAYTLLNSSFDWVREQVSKYQKRRDIIDQAVSANGKISWLKPEGTFYGWLDFSHLIENNKNIGLSKILLEQYRMLLVDGSAYFSRELGYMRMSFATSDETIEKAAEIISSIQSIK